MSTKTMPRTMQQGGNPFEMLAISLLLVGAIFYAMVALSTKDPFWLIPSHFDTRPVAIEIYHDGAKQLLEPGDPTFERLVSLVNGQIDQRVGYYEHSMRPEDIQTAKEQSTTVIFVYGQVINIRSQWNLGDPTHLFIPVTGALSGKNIVFTGVGDKFGHGGLIVKDLSPFYDTVRDLVGDD